ncbi:MAG: C4-type zinc ribbon domain-containing protein [Candidatus Auribacterota bacterium]|jgi:predicted  nucleic acid-binding Zn-ribbon protein|uniref:C4-type zinc ribbon domain-containing protein n=1 Tax=Candidatus Auribacter fodinae TaxID=2093366 RepID=A0A3A4R2V7_9BACT|nr:MAG: hypothetical protein C4541_04115 [Candidatus Auribacter fodinae]
MKANVEVLVKLQSYENDLKKCNSESQRKQIEDEIIFLKTQTPTETLTRFYKLYHRHGDAIVRANGGFCQGCFINLPTSQHSLLSYSDDMSVCQNCGRFLYIDSEETVAIF